MLITKSPPMDSTDVSARERESFVLAVRPHLYILLLVAVAVGVGAHSFRRDSIFSCRASGYASDRYIAYCGGKNYGDYEHGAFWFNLEPAATAAAAKSRVMFLGNSRMQFAFSSKATADWFSSLSESYYLLGFSAFGNYMFEAPLLRKIHPTAKVYVINIDSFLDQSESPPARLVMQDGLAQSRYEQKRQWQRIHKAICARFEIVCGHTFALFRSRSSGAWLMSGLQYKMDPVPVSYDEDVDQSMVQSYTTRGNEFLPSLPVDRTCTILTIVPTVKTTVGTAKAVAASLGLSLVAPMPAGLITFDGSHLTPEGAQNWSAAFLEEAGPQIRKCLGQ